MATLILHPPVLPYGYTLHHRFARIWEVADYLQQRDYGVTVMDAGLLNMLQGQIVAEFSKEYTAVAIYCELGMTSIVRDLVRQCKAVSPRTKILIYGPAALYAADRFNESLIDGIGFQGDFECQLLQFINWSEGANPVGNNVAIRSHHDWIRPAGLAETAPAEEWGWPRFHEMPIGDIRRIYRMKKESLKVAVTASRGCPYSCTFCHTPALEGRVDRRRRVADLVDFMATNSREYDCWQLYSPTFTLNRNWCLSLCEEMISKQLRVRWKCTTRVDRLDPALVEKMAASGCYMVGVGVETIGETLPTLHKNTTTEQIGRAIRLLTAHGIIAKAYIILGLPGQSLSEARNSIEVAQRLGARVRTSIYSPRGVDMHRNASYLSDESDPLTGFERRGGTLELAHYGEYLRYTFGDYRGAERDTGRPINDPG